MNPKMSAWLTAFFACLIWSAINPKDYFTWALEVLPAVIALLLLGFTRSRYQFTPLVYCLVLIHCLILMVGGHYTYAEVPFFDELLGMQRNNYDKLGHFAQGFVPAMVAREILITHRVVNGKGWLALFVVSFCLGFSAFYELIEWFAAEATETGAAAFLGTQGYAWDTQSDMAFALIGAVAALLFLSAWHDRQLAEGSR